MTQFFSLYLLWLGLLLVRFSSELSQDFPRARKLCGSYLLKEIVRLCGRTNWGQFENGDEPSGAQLSSQDSHKANTFNRIRSEPNRFRSYQAPSQVGRRITNPASTSISQEEATNSWETQYRKTKWLPKKTRELSLSRDVNPYIQESAIFQKKSANEMKILNNVFWGKHPQRKRRGYSDKCCLKGCTKEELAIACLPYINF